MDSVKLIFNRTLVLNIVANAVAASVAFCLASVRSRVFLGLRILNDQFACSVRKLILFVFVASNDIVAILHPLNVRLRSSADAALQRQNVMMQVVAL